MQMLWLRQALLGGFLAVAVGLVGCDQSADAPTSPSALPDAGSVIGSNGGGGAGGSGNSDGPDDPGSVGEDPDSDDDANGGGTGRIVVKLTDLPVSDATALLVTFSDLSIHQTGGGWVTINDTPVTCDLLQLQDGVTDDLGVADLEAGHYTQVRLTVASAEIFFGFTTAGNPACAPAIADDGTGMEVDVPSGVVRLVRQFRVPEGGLTTMLLDFDAHRSVREIGAGNANRPTMGPPDGVGPPDDAGPPNDHGPPDGAGPPEDPGNGNDGAGQNTPQYVMVPAITIIGLEEVG